MSPDSVDSHAKFRKKYDLAIQLAADADKAVAKAYGVWVEKSMYGRKYMGVERSTFLIDRKGRIAGAGARSRCPATPRRCWLRPKRWRDRKHAASRSSHKSETQFRSPRRASPR